MKTNPSGITNEPYGQFDTVVAQTEQLLKSVATAGSNKAGAVKANVKQALAAAAARLEEIRQQAVSQAKAAANSTDEYVRDNPWRAIGIAAALSASLGLVAGLLIARR
jgi:ElaB/YqjD/DUF883 family membrane-anchored ribosome-binding protein